MKIPELPKIIFSKDEKTKSDKIIRQLKRLGYEIYNAKKAIAIFETHDIDKSQFDFPYDSFEAYKQHVLAGDLDYDLTSCIITKEQHDQNIKDVKDGKSWEIY